MMSFRHDKLAKMNWPNETLRLVGQIQEFKGKQDLFKQQQPEVLEALRDAAVIQSTESSNRLEGIVINTKRLSSIVQKKVQPQNRSESEVAGYRDVLATVHASAEYMNLKPGLILQMDRDLMQYAGNIGGRFKNNDNTITESYPDGTKRIRFVTVPAWRTPAAIDELVNAYRQDQELSSINELILIAAFTLDFLCIHPFPDGNGRMARLLTLLLLYQTGYEVGRYVSLEKVIEETKEQYYETLEQSSTGWHEGGHNLLPWINYFLVMLLKSYQRFEERVGQTSDLIRLKGWKGKKVRDVVEHMMADFTIQDIQERCPGISRPTIQRTLSELGQSGLIVCIEQGRNAKWKKVY